MITITNHAAERFVERIAPQMTVDQARAAIRASLPAIEATVGFGCSSIKLGCGARLVLEGEAVVTVVPVLRPLKRRRRERELTP